MSIWQIGMMGIGLIVLCLGIEIVSAGVRFIVGLVVEARK